LSAEPPREALFHCQFGVVQPSRGDVLHKVAAYNSATGIEAPDGTLYDFSRKAAEHVGGCILLPNGAPADYADPAALWSAAQAAETRVDGQPARLVEFAIPREVPADQRLEFTRSIVAPWVEETGAAAQVDVHCPRAADGGEQPHAHVILSRRALGPEGFAERKLSNAPWTANRGKDMRAEVAARMNAWLADNEIAVRVDHRSHRERGDPTPPEPNVSRAAVETWKRRADEATAFTDTLAARPVRRHLRDARRELAAAEAEIADLRREYSRRVPGLQGPRHRRRAVVDPAWLPPVGDGVAAVEPQRWGATITLADGSAVVVRADRILIRGPVTDAAIAAVADQAVRQGWAKDGVELTGSPASRDRLAAALAIRGVAVTNHPEPPSSAALEAARQHYDGPVARRPDDLLKSAGQHLPTSPHGDLNVSSDADPTASPAADSTPPEPQGNRRHPAGSTAPTSASAPTRRYGDLLRSPDAGATARPHGDINIPSSVEATARRGDRDRRRALAVLAESERHANADYAAGRITTAQLQAARRPTAAVATGDQATIEAALRGDFDGARQAAECWHVERDRRAAAAARRTAAASEPTSADPAPAPAYRPPWATGPKTKNKEGKRA